MSSAKLTIALTKELIRNGALKINGNNAEQIAKETAVFLKTLNTELQKDGTFTDEFADLLK